MLVQGVRLVQGDGCVLPGWIGIGFEKGWRRLDGGVLGRSYLVNVQ